MELGGFGPVFAGRYRGETFIKRGQGVETWLGRDPEGRPVVLKTAPRVAISEAAKAWLELEVDILGATRNPAALQPEGVGTDGDTLYLARPYVEGKSLRKWLEDEPPSIEEVLALAVRILCALEEVHERGVVHGDLKPDNIVIRGGSPADPVVVDFGLSRHALLPDALEDVSAEEALYLSPEQAGLIQRGVDGRADLYALGLVLYEALTRRPAVHGDDLSEVLRGHLAVALPPIDTLLTGVPRALARIVDRLLRKDPRDRYQTARAARADLEELATALEQGERDPEMVVGARDARAALTEPAFTGRAAELAALDAALDDAVRGAGGLVFVEGESGGGKTWLLEEFGRRASGRGAWVVRGQGLAEVAPHPFQLLSAVAREVSASALARPSRRRRIERGAEATGHAVGEALPELSGIVGKGSGPGGPDVYEDERSQAALCEFLDSLGSEDEPAAVLVDDSQWADARSLRLLARWRDSRAEAGRHVVVVVAFRAEDVAGDHPLAAIEPTQRIELGRFRDDEVREQVASMAGEIPDPAVDIVVRSAAGNPFLASAVLAGLVETGALARTRDEWRVDEDALAELQVAGQKAALLEARIARLSPAADRFLRVGALLGRSFDPAFAGDLAGLGAGEAVRIAGELRGGLIWVDRRGSRCTLLHDRIREALLGRLPHDERRRLHRLAAERLERRHDASPFDLAYHYDAAGEPQRALPFAVEAAETARARHDAELAERYYRMASRAVPDAGDPKLRYRVARGLGDVLVVRSRYDESARYLDEAYELAPDDLARADIEERRTQLALKIGDLTVAANHGERALRLIGRHVPRSSFVCTLIVLWQLAVQVLHTAFPGQFVGRRSAPDGDARAASDAFAMRIYHSLCAPYFFARGAVWALWAHLLELNLSERYPPSTARGRAYGLHGAMCSGFPKLFERAVRYTRRGAALCAERGDLWGQARATQFLALSLCATGRYRQAIEAGDESARLFDRVGDRWEANGPLAWSALARYREGDLAGAAETARYLFDRGRELDDAHGVSFGADAWARATEGHLPEDVLSRELAGREEHVQNSALIAQAEAIRLLAAGRPEEAESLLCEWLGRIRGEGVLLHESSVSLVIYRAEAARRRAEDVPAADPRRRARILARARKSCREALRVARKFKNTEPHALREAARVAAMSGRPGRARALADRSVAAADRLGARFEAALSRHARGELGEALAWDGAAADLAKARAELHAMRIATAPPSARVTVSLIERFRALLAEGRRIARALSTERVYEALRDGALALVRAPRCSVLERGDDGAASVVYGDAQPVSAGMVREALETERPVAWPRPERPMAADDTLSRSAIRSALCVPIVVRGRVTNFLYLTHGEVDGAFGDDETQIAEFLTTLAGAALENAEGFAKIEAFSRELEERVEARTADLARANQELAGSLEELESTQAELLHAGRMAAVGTLVAGLSHELNNPLTVIVGNAENLLNRAAGDGASRAPLEAIERHAKRAAKLVAALLDFSRTGTPSREPVEADELVDTVVEIVSSEARRRDIELRTSRHPEAPAPLVSQREIESALVNITTNALDVTPPGGAVDISVEPATEGGVRGVRFVISDSGPGISAAVLPQIFDPFFTTKPEGQGTGLGLSLARRAVSAHGGYIRVDSTSSEGTALALWLPAAPIEA